MLDMCALDGWRETTLNPDMPDPDKVTVATTQFDKILGQDDPDEQYAALVRLSAVTMAWAQGIERRATRDRRRVTRAAKRVRRAERKRQRAEEQAGLLDRDRSDSDH